MQETNIRGGGATNGHIRGGGATNGMQVYYHEWHAGVLQEPSGSERVSTGSIQAWGQHGFNTGVVQYRRGVMRCTIVMCVM